MRRPRPDALHPADVAEPPFGEGHALLVCELRENLEPVGRDRPRLLEVDVDGMHDAGEAGIGGKATVAQRGRPFVQLIPDCLRLGYPARLVERVVIRAQEPEALEISGRQERSGPAEQVYRSASVAVRSSARRPAPRCRPARVATASSGLPVPRRRSCRRLRGGSR